MSGYPRQRDTAALILHAALNEKNPRTFVRGFFFQEPGSVLLSHGHCHTTIDAEPFHFGVRDGNRWFQLAMAARQTGGAGAEATTPDSVVVKHRKASQCLKALRQKMLECYMVKPHEQLVRVSFMHYCTSTSRLSTLSSTRALKAD